MRRMMFLVPLLAIVIVQVSIVYASDGGGWITGGGILGLESQRGTVRIGGSASTMKDGAVRGIWSTVWSENVFVGEVTYLLFSLSEAHWGGTGKLNSASDYLFEASYDGIFYRIVIYSPGPTLYADIGGTLSGGRILVHAPNNGHP